MHSNGKFKVEPDGGCVRCFPTKEVWLTLRFVQKLSEIGLLTLSLNTVIIINHGQNYVNKAQVVK